VQVADRAPEGVRADALVLPAAAGPAPGPGVREVSDALGMDLGKMLRRREWTGRTSETLVVPTTGRIPADSVILVGVGAGSPVSPGAIRDAAITVARSLGGAKTVATTVPQAGDDVRAAAEAFVEGLELGGFRFDRYHAHPVTASPDSPWRLSTLTLLMPRKDRAAAADGARRGQVLAGAANWARELVTTPAGDATPEALAEEARAMADQAGITCRVWTPARLAREGFGGVLGVGRGSSRTPRMVELAYGSGRGRPLALTGKGITYDSGGLVLKKLAELEWMKADMAGAAAVLATFRAVAELGIDTKLIAALPFADNMTGSDAIHPGDVLTHRGGRTSEVVDTDCEGRLVLADVLAYLCEKHPAAVVDAATLTDAGGLGDGLWAVLGTDRALVDELLEAGRQAGDPGWELPLPEEYLDLLRSSVADIRNAPKEGADTTVMAALYLRPFVGDVPWAHLDIGSTAWFERDTDRWPRGATGSPTRTLIRWIESRASRGAG
jgi:leucyl aminopeptidase